MPPVTISVCIPVYNCHAHVAQAVDSVLAQTFGDFELIIVDNCSADGTFELLQEYADPRIRLLRNPENIGACGNWNRLLAEASGRYVKIICADDFIYPQCLERQLAVLEAADSDVVMVSSGRDIVDERGRNVFRRHFPGKKGRMQGEQVIRKIVQRGTNIIGEVSAVLFRHEVIAKAGEFDGSLPYVIDLDYWVRVLRHGDLVVMDDYLAAFRVSAASWSVGIADSQTSDFTALIARINDDYGIKLSRVAMLVGRAMARLNSLLRRIFYRLYLRR